MEFDETILATCKYALYTLNGTFGEVMAYLEGYAKAAKIGKSGSYFSQFAKWLSESRGYTNSDSRPHSDFWRLFRKRYPDDATAIAEFARLWMEYRGMEYQATLKALPDDGKSTTLG
jgi:FMN phosphatase YigB (HAD superfamily)